MKKINIPVALITAGGIFKIQIALFTGVMISWWLWLLVSWQSGSFGYWYLDNLVALVTGSSSCEIHLQMILMELQVLIYLLYNISVLFSYSKFWWRRCFVSYSENLIAVPCSIEVMINKICGITQCIVK